MVTRVRGSDYWSVPIEQTPIEQTPIGRVPRGRGAPSILNYPRSWLLLDLPTAILLAVFVGTGWLGYAHPPSEHGSSSAVMVFPPDAGAAPAGPH